MEREKKQAGLGWDCLGMKGAEEGSRSAGRVKGVSSRGLGRQDRWVLGGDMGVVRERGPPHTWSCRRNKKGKGITREKVRKARRGLPGASSLYPKVHDSAINSSHIYK